MTPNKVYGRIRYPLSTLAHVWVDTEAVGSVIGSHRPVGRGDWPFHLQIRQLTLIPNLTREILNVEIKLTVLYKKR